MKILKKNKIIEKGSKKIDTDKILEKIAKQIQFQKQRMKAEENSYGLSKNQRKKLYESIISSIGKVTKLREQLGIKSEESSICTYYKHKLKNVNEAIKRSQIVGKRIILLEKVYKNKI